MSKSNINDPKNIVVKHEDISQHRQIKYSDSDEENIKQQQDDFDEDGDIQVELAHEEKDGDVENINEQNISVNNPDDDNDFDDGWSKHNDFDEASIDIKIKLERDGYNDSD